MILNSANLVGRVSSGFITRHTGVPVLMIITTFAFGVLILAMIGLSSLASVVVLGVLYGYFSGICEHYHVDASLSHLDRRYCFDGAAHGRAHS